MEIGNIDTGNNSTLATLITNSSTHPLQTHPLLHFNVDQQTTIDARDHHML